MTGNYSEWLEGSWGAIQEDC